jgi:hypothetical protein
VGSHLIPDDIKRYISDETTKELLKHLKQFPLDINKHFYCNKINQDNDIIYQADGVDSVSYYDSSTKISKDIPCIIISNTCDVDQGNIRDIDNHLLYTPVFRLSQFIEMLKKNGLSEPQIESKVSSIRKQKITSIFYLPEIQGKIEESIIFFDRIINCENKIIPRSNLNKTRLFRLSNTAYIMFIYKLFIHFCRSTIDTTREI